MSLLYMRCWKIRPPVAHRLWVLISYRANVTFTSKSTTTLDENGAWHFHHHTREHNFLTPKRLHIRYNHLITDVTLLYKQIHGCIKLTPNISQSHWLHWWLCWYASSPLRNYGSSPFALIQLTYQYEASAHNMKMN